MSNAAKGKQQVSKDVLMFAMSVMMLRVFLTLDLIEELELSVPRPQKRLLNQLQSNLSNSLTEFLSQLVANKQESPLIDGKSISLSMFLKVHEALVLLALDLKECNWTIQTLATLPKFPRELFIYIESLEDVFETTGDDQKHKMQIPVVLFNPDYSYESYWGESTYDASGRGEDEKILVPAIDVKNVLMWPNIAHEIGHIVFGRSSTRFTQDLEIKSKDRRATETLVQWSTETFADICASRMTQSSYVFALSGFYMSMAAESYDYGEYPALASRISVCKGRQLQTRFLSSRVSGFCDRLIAMCEQLKYPILLQGRQFKLDFMDQTQALSKVAESVKGSTRPQKSSSPSQKPIYVTSSEAEDVIKTATQLSQYIEINLGDRNLFSDVIRCKKLVNDLKSLYPICSYINKNNLDRLIQLSKRTSSKSNQDSDKNASTARERRSLVNEFAQYSGETPLKANEIIELGWVYFVEEHIPKFLRSLDTNLSDLNKRIDQLREETRSMNDCLLRSIGLADTLAKWQKAENDVKQNE